MESPVNPYGARNGMCIFKPVATKNIVRIDFFYHGYRAVPAYRRYTMSVIAFLDMVGDRLIWPIWFPHLRHRFAENSSCNQLFRNTIGVGNIVRGNRASGDNEVHCLVNGPVGGDQSVDRDDLQVT